MNEVDFKKNWFRISSVLILRYFSIIPNDLTLIYLHSCAKLEVHERMVNRADQSSKNEWLLFVKLGCSFVWFWFSLCSWEIIYFNYFWFLSRPLSYNCWFAVIIPTYKPQIVYVGILWIIQYCFALLSRIIVAIG